MSFYSCVCNKTSFFDNNGEKKNAIKHFKNLKETLSRLFRNIVSFSSCFGLIELLVFYLRRR